MFWRHLRNVNLSVRDRATPNHMGISAGWLTRWHFNRRSPSQPIGKLRVRQCRVDVGPYVQALTTRFLRDVFADQLKYRGHSRTIRPGVKHNRNTSFEVNQFT
jgi:hypothetical protein